uniref:Uncharacterized protein n=1 Tax=Melanopsichium pennsylvanicum 4 TaxID=1398559 RepID=A0A077R8J0_9BASI|nr:uncharacterized protein BN887_06112 [Melanopsichium pennsylvanicum 4]
MLTYNPSNQSARVGKTLGKGSRADRRSRLPSGSAGAEDCTAGAAKEAIQFAQFNHRVLLAEHSRETVGFLP